MRYIPVLFAFLIFTSLAFGATSTGVVTPFSPAKGTVNIGFTASSTDGNEIIAELLYIVNDTNTAIATPSLLSDYQNPSSNNDLDCTASNPDANSFSCTFAWNTSGINNTSVKIVVRTYTSGIEGKTEAQSNPIIIDNLVPTVTFLQPNDSNKASYESNFISFDVNDSGGAGVNVITVDFNDITGENFSKSSHCTQHDANYHCQYNEVLVNTGNRNYTFSVNVIDNAGNSLSSLNSITFTHMDSNAPGQVTGLSASNGDIQSVLTWSSLPITDLNAYFVYMSTTNGFTGEPTTFVGSSTTNSFTKTGLTNGTTYYFRVRAGDKTGNMGALSDQASATPAATSTSLAAPEISSSTHSESDANWSTGNDPQFTWSTVSNAAKYRYAFNETSDTVPDSNNETTERSKSYSNVADGVHYFHVRACNSSNECGPTDHYRIRVDTTSPDPVSNLSGARQSDGSILLSWDDPADTSGIRSYSVYRHTSKQVNGNDFLPGDSGVRKFTDVTSNSFRDTQSLTAGIDYFYRVQTYDNAGNIGAMTAVLRVPASSQGCSITLSSDVPEFVKAGMLNFTITTSGGKINSSRVRGKIGSTGERILIPSTQGTSIDSNILIEQGAEGSGTIRIAGKDDAGGSCEKEFSFTIDNTSPQIEIISPASGEEISDQAEFSFRVNEANGIGKVKALVDGEEVYSTQSSGPEYTFEFNAGEFGNGEHTILIEATDKAGNSASASRKFKTQGSAETLSEKEYTFNTSELANLIRNSGIKDEFVSKAKDLTGKSETTRKLTLIKDGNTYSAKITLTLTNSGSGKLGVIEVIPKSIAQSASSVESETKFTVLKDDPVIRFDVEKEGLTTISYTVASGLSEQEAQRISNSFASFAAPPIVLEQKDAQSPLREESNWVLIAAIAIVGVLFIGLLVLGGGAAIVFLHKHGKHSSKGGFEPPKEPTKTEMKNSQEKGKYNYKGK